MPGEIRKLCPADYATWNKLTFTYPNDSGFILNTGKDYAWAFGDGTKPDSLAAVNLIKTISEQNYGSFVNNYDSSGKQPVFMLRIEGSGFSPVVIKAFPADTANKYAISSTLNPGTFISGSKGGLLDKIFPGKKAFFRKDFKPLPKAPVTTQTIKGKR